MVEEVAKQSLYAICSWGSSGDDKEVSKILDNFPSLLNEVISSHGDISSLVSTYDIVVFGFWRLDCIDFGL